MHLGLGPATPPQLPSQPRDVEPASSQARSPWPTVIVVAVLIVGGLVANLINQQVHSSDSVPQPAAASVGNAILFVVDDMPDFSCAETDLYLPRSSRWLRDQGTCYESATTSTPVCCPARAQLQTGQLSHNNRVVSQIAAKNLDVRDTVQHDLGLLGIDTYGIGKNLNGIDAAEYYGDDAIDNGFADFNFWNAYRGAPGAFRLYDDTGAKYTPTDGLNTTETNGAYLETYLDDKLESGDPFFVYDAFFAPHKQGVSGRAEDLPPVSVNHADDPVPPFRYAPEGFDGDKLPIFQGTRFSRAYYQRLFTARARALLDVDDQMATVFERLEATDTLDKTAVIFVSDNGYTDRGQDNWEGKSIPYPASTNIAMLARFPGRAPTIETKPVALIDIAPTLYDVFDIVPGHVVDGHSLLSEHRRELVYAEFYNENSGLSRRESGPLVSNLRSWRLIKQGRRSYVEWYGNGGDIVFREFYEDPAMTKNLLSPAHRTDRPSPTTVRTFQQLLERHGTCQGTEEQGSPSPCP